MKKIIYTLIAALMLATSCSDFTDVQPKGKNLLATTGQLEMLLNNQFTLDDKDMRQMSGDIISAFEDIPTLLSSPNKTRQAILLAWDEANIEKMAELTISDGTYVTAYSIIGKISNAILSKVDDATGPQDVKDQLRCEALVLRAYYHYILVNKFAKAYNPSTADNDPAIPYVTEEWDISVPTEKATVKEVYDNIIRDLDEAIQLNALPDKAVNRMRMNKTSAYAVKALALLNMQQFDKAATVAEQALALNSTINNYNQMLTTLYGFFMGGAYPVIYRPHLQCEEDIFYTYGTESFNAITPYAWDAFEMGHASKDKMTIDLMVYDYMMGMGSMLIGLDYVFSYDFNSGWNSSGIKTTQMHLIIAEAELRKGNFDLAMRSLDAIRVNRIDSQIYAPLEGTVNNSQDAIFHLKQTAHGENIYTIHNFINKKRWNLFDDYKETLTRTIDGIEYELRPDSKMWIFPIPANAVNINPNLLPQNYSL